MAEGIEIRGGAGPFEAAAVVAVIDHVLAAEATARATPPRSNLPPAWMQSAWPRRPEQLNDPVFPEHRGDPL